MYQFRIGQPADQNWLQWASANAAWESLSADERAGAAPAEVAGRSAEQVREVLGTPGSLALIAQVGAMPVGYALATVAPDSTTGESNGLVLALWVAPEHRGRGVGRHLFRLIENWLASTGVRKAKLWTGLHNQAFHRMAVSCGYRPEGLIGTKAL